MRPRSLEDREAALEEKVAPIQIKAVLGKKEKPWQRNIGQFGCFKEVFDEATELREKDRRKTRPKRQSAKRAKT